MKRIIEIIKLNLDSLIEMYFNIVEKMGVYIWVNVQKIFSEIVDIPLSFLQKTVHYKLIMYPNFSGVIIWGILLMIITILMIYLIVGITRISQIVYYRVKVYGIKGIIRMGEILLMIIVVVIPIIIFILGIRSIYVNGSYSLMWEGEGLVKTTVISVVNGKEIILEMYLNARDIENIMKIGSKEYISLITRDTHGEIWNVPPGILDKSYLLERIEEYEIKSSLESSKLKVTLGGVTQRVACVIVIGSIYYFCSK